MTAHLTPEGYLQTLEKLENMKRRLAALDARTDLNPTHASEARRSCLDMLGQDTREIKLYEAQHGPSTARTG